jgi:hypothetical protein
VRSVAVDLFDRRVTWFIRMFTPPDAHARAAVDLAEASFAGQDQIDLFRATIASPHQLRLFFGRLLDPAWLAALEDAGLVPMPRSGEPWAVAGVVDGLARTHPREVADLLKRLLASTCSLEPPRGVEADFELLRVATSLDAAGHPAVREVV